MATTGGRGGTESSAMCAKPDGMRRVQRSAAATQASLGPVRVADPRTTRRPTHQRRLLRSTSRRRFNVLGTKQLLRLQIPHRRNSQTRRNFLGFLRRPDVFPLLIPHHHHLLLHLLPFSLPLLSHMQPHLLPSHVFLTSPLLHLAFFLLPIVLLDLIRHLFLSLLLLLNLFLLLLNIFLPLLLLLLLLVCLCLCSLQLLLRSLQRLLRFLVSRHPHFRLFPKFCVLASLPSSMSPSRRKTIGRTFLRKSPKG